MGVALFLLLSAASMSAQSPPTAPALFSTDLATGLVLGVRVDPAGVQALLPPPWQLRPAPSGSNLRVLFYEWLRNEDGKGRPSPGTPERYVAFTTTACHAETGECSAFPLQGYKISAESPNYYGTHLAVKIALERAVHSPDPATVTVSEHWQAREATGGMLVELVIEYSVDPGARSRATSLAPPPKAEGEAKVRSSLDPTRWRIYREDRLRDVVMSRPDGIDRLKKYTLTVTAPKLSRLFDGSAQLLTVEAIPWYLRQTYAPKP